MLHNDKAMFALLLLRVYLSTCTKEPVYDAQFDYLLRNSEMLIADAAKSMPKAAASTPIAGLNQKHMIALAALSHFKNGFENCVQTASALNNMDRFVSEDKPEIEVRILWADDAQLSKRESRAIALIF